MRQTELNAAPITIVGTRGKELHVYEGHLVRGDAIARANAESSYPEATTYFVLHSEFDATKPKQAAEKIHDDALKMRQMIFK